MANTAHGHWHLGGERRVRVRVRMCVYPASPGPCSLVLSSGLFAECSRAKGKWRRLNLF